MADSCLKYQKITVYLSIILIIFLSCLGPQCRDEMEHKCEIETYYHPEKSITSENQHTSVSNGNASLLSY